MSKYTPEQARAVYEQSMRLLADAPPREASPPPREVQIPEEDAVERWKREANELEAERAATKCEMRRQHERDMQRRQNDAMAPLSERMDALEERVSAIEQALAGLDALANGSATFSTAVTEKLNKLDALTAKVDTALSELRGRQKSELDALHTKHTAEAQMRARELIAATREMAEVRSAIARLDSQREREFDRGLQVKTSDEVVVQLAAIRESLAERR
jgi:hypothetical protein